MPKIQKIPIVLAATHLLLVVVTAVHIERSAEPQAPMLWLRWTIPDFPVSLLYVAIAPVTAVVRETFGQDSLLAYIFYAPYFIHGVLGTLWWYLMPRAILSGYNRVIARQRTGDTSQHGG